MNPIYCTYFDHRYLARGLAMIRSLRRMAPGAQVWVLCLDDRAHDLLSGLREPGVTLLRTAELEREDRELKEARGDGRSLIEFYFTCTAPLVRHVMRATGAGMVTYLDGDLWFFADPQPIYDEMGESSVLIIPHRFPPSQRAREKFGRFNVGWISFRSDARGVACLEWWRARTLEWCRDEVDETGQRFADQRYLDRFAELFPGVHILRHNGANLAPWNLGTHSLAWDGKTILVDGRDPLLFFHFHGLKRLPFGRFLTTDHLYGARRSNIVRRGIYAPYLRNLTDIEQLLSPALRAQESVRDETKRHGAGPVDRLRGLLRFLVALFRGRTVAP